MNVLVVQAAMEGESRYGELTGELTDFAYYWNTLARERDTHGGKGKRKERKKQELPPAIAEKERDIRLQRRPLPTGKDIMLQQSQNKLETWQEIVGVRKNKRVKVAEKAEQENESEWKVRPKSAA